jgi:hypothetical protein
MPEQHGTQACHTEDEGEGEKIPLLAEEIYVGIAKKLQAKAPGFKVSEVSTFQGSIASKWPLPAILTLKP